MISQEEVQRLTELASIFYDMHDEDVRQCHSLSEIIDLLPRLLADRERLQSELRAARKVVEVSRMVYASAPYSGSSERRALDVIEAYYSKYNLGMKEEDK